MLKIFQKVNVMMIVVLTTVSLKDAMKVLITKTQKNIFPTVHGVELPYYTQLFLSFINAKLSFNFNLVES